MMSLKFKNFLIGALADTDNRNDSKQLFIMDARREKMPLIHFIKLPQEFSCLI